jgi:hypothetical protein
VLAYGLVLLLTVGTFVLYGFESVVSNRPAPHNKAVLVFNPIIATADIVAGHSGSVGSSSPFTSIRNSLRSDAGSGSIARATVVPVPVGGFGVASGAVVGPNGFVSGGNTANPGRSGPPYGGISLVCFGLLCAGSLMLAVRRLRTPGRSDRT